MKPKMKCEKCGNDELRVEGIGGDGHALYSCRKCGHEQSGARRVL